MSTSDSFCGRCGAPRSYATERYCRYCGAALGRASSAGSSRFCTMCGRERASGGAQCQGCGVSFDGPAEDPRVAKLDEASSLEISYYQTSLRMVLLLSLLTFGLYLPIWMGLTWSEMKHVFKDPRMYPVLHGLSAVVPIYGWLRFHAHCKAINYVTESGGGIAIVRPGWVVLGVIVGETVGVSMIWTSGGLLLLLWVLLAGLIGGALAHAQAGLNCYRRSLSVEETPVHVRGWEWAMLLFGGFFTLIALFAAFPEGEG